MTTAEKTKPKRYALDNSSQFYPIMATKKKQSLYRITAVLRDEVNVEKLKCAVNGVMKRFPTFAVRLKKGYSWYYLEENNAEVKVFPSDGVLLRPIFEEETNGYLFRIIHDGKEVSLEVFHGLCDANGAMCFLFAVLQKYRLLTGTQFASTDGLLDLNAEPTEDEFEDAFKRHYRNIKFGDIDLKGLTGGAPLLLSGTLADNFSCNIYSSAYSDVAKHAKDMNVTFTAFVVGLLAYTIEKLEKSDKPIVMMVPVNLRKVFPSNNCRNFVTFVRLVFEHKSNSTIEDYALSAGVQLKEKCTEEKLAAMVSTTVRSERALRFIPLWFKSFFAKIIRVFLKSRQTIILSNLGNVKVPDELKIEKLKFIMNASKNSKVNLGVCSMNGEVYFNFMKSIEECTLEDAFVSELKKLGVTAQLV